MEYRYKMINPQLRNNKVQYLIVSFFMLSVMDAVITLEAMEIGLRELNGLMAFFINMGGFYFFTIKMLLTSIVCLFAFYFMECGTELQNKYMYKTIQVITFGYICIVINNLVWIMKYSI